MRIMSSIRAGLAGLLVSGAAFAEAPELSIFHTIVIDRPADVVWEMAGDFGGIQRWAPGTESSRLVLRDRNETGAIRELRRRSDGTRVTEKLLDYDPYNRRMVYTYVDGEVRAADYWSELVVKEEGPNRSRVEWRGRFKRLDYWTDRPRPGRDDRAVLDFLDGAYRNGLQGLKRVLEAGSD